LDRNRVAEKRRLISIKEQREEDSSDSDSDWSQNGNEEEVIESDLDEDDNQDLEPPEVDVLEQESETMTSSYVDCSENDTRASTEIIPVSQRISLTNPPACRVCYRKSPSGFHCEFCEYDVCGICSDIFCTRGHKMAIWNAGYDVNGDTNDTASKYDAADSVSILDNGSRRNSTENIYNFVHDGDCNIGYEQSSLGLSTTVLSHGASHPPEYTCALCKTPGITSGYQCFECEPEAAYLCDLCTAFDGRRTIRKRWDDELDEIIAFMKREKNFSDIARYNIWLNKAVIVSLKLLVEHVREMKEQQRRAGLQIKYKKHIDIMKAMRREIIAQPSICAVSRIEAATDPDWVFETKRDLRREHDRLSDIILVSSQLKSFERRLEHRFACPLGHGTIPVQSTLQLPMLFAESKKFRRKMYGVTAGEDRKGGSRDVDILHIRPNSESMDEIGEMEASDVPCVDEFTIQSDTEDIKCAVCSCQDVQGGRFCLFCEYVVCSTCSFIYCRKGHPCKIWTMPEAQSMRCDVCFTCPIGAGYRCTECEIDICTGKETRITMQLFPMREANKIFSYFDLVQEQSDIARSYVARYGTGNATTYSAMNTGRMADAVKAGKFESMSGVQTEPLAVSTKASLFGKFSMKDFRDELGSDSKITDLKEHTGFSSPAKSIDEKPVVSPSRPTTGATGAVVVGSPGHSRPTTGYTRPGTAPAWYEAEPKYVFESSLIWNRDAGPLQVGGSMSHTCCVLLELKAAKTLVEEELGLKKLRTTQSAGAKASARARQQQIVKAWGSDM
jgi:hypothetical protein